jgi:hypothetical protein
MTRNRKKEKKNGPAVSNVTLSVDSINWCGIVSRIFIYWVSFFPVRRQVWSAQSFFLRFLLGFFCSSSGWSKSRSDCAHYVNGKEEGSISTGFCKNSTSAIVFVFLSSSQTSYKKPPRNCGTACAHLANPFVFIRMMGPDWANDGRSFGMDSTHPAAARLSALLPCQQLYVPLDTLG